MNLDSNDDDSEESDILSSAGDDVDVHLNHYRVPKSLNYGPYGLSDQPSNGSGTHKSRVNLKQVKFSNEGKIMSLFELAAQKVACHFPFGLVENFYQPVPEPMQCRIAFWSFPQDEEDVKLYTCLANGNADFFYRAEELIFQNAVRDMLQVGFHLSANVVFMDTETEHSETNRVALTFDRRRITSCSCTCIPSTFWCQHVVAVCLQRIRKPSETKLRAPVSESLQRLEKNQLQKFAQYLINELPQQILPAAQKLLDELLSGDDASINKNPAAPDPTAGALLNEQTSWCLDYTHLGLDIHRILLKQCTAQPTVCSDIQSLHVTAPPATTEYTQLLRPIRGREPEGIWNLISIVGEMMKRRDLNLFPLLEIMTDEIMKFDKIITWWFETKVSLHSGSTIHFANTKNSQCTSQYSCSNFCDEIVHLWRLAALNPSSTPVERNKLYRKFLQWHLSILKRHVSLSENQANNLSYTGKRNYLELFPGFKSAMEGCLVNWSDWDEKRGELRSASNKNDEEKPAKRNKRKRRAKGRNSGIAQASAVSPQAENSASCRNDENKENSTEPTVMNPTKSALAPAHSRQNVNVENSEHCLKPSRSKVNVSPEAEQPSPELQEQSSSRQEDDQLEEREEVPQEPQDPLEEADPNARLDRIRENNAPNIDFLEPDLQVYFMEGHPEPQRRQDEPESLSELIRLNDRRLADPLETLYSKVEGLHAHGHLEEARKAAAKLAHEILSQRNYPNVRLICTASKRRRKKGPLDNQTSIMGSETLSKLLFLCNLLHDDHEAHSIIFKLVMFGVEMRRSPAATKPLEVKLISQKQELISLMKTITLSDTEISTLKEKAQNIRDSKGEAQRDVLATLILGNFIFEAFVLSRNASISPSDVDLGFQTAISALGVKVNVAEADHPLLCEGIRRQRGELALSLILHYKDDQEKLDAILKQLLDKDLLEPARQPLPTTVSEKPAAPASKPLAEIQNNRNTTNLSGRKSHPIVQDPNQPSEAAAHFMFELAKTVFDKAGGNSTTAHLFRPQLVASNGTRGIHRKLHMCTLRIALYALGLQNRTSPNWMQRTYNGRASFIHDQALELGLPALKFLWENWEGYLTPVEAASVADKAGCSSDSETRRIAAEMAKSCLKYANFLDSNAVSRILVQCQEQTVEMIEEACDEIEQVAENENVGADVLFVTARAWYSLYTKLDSNDRNHSGNANLYQLNNFANPSIQGPNEHQAGAHEQPPIVDWLANSTVQYQQPPVQIHFQQSSSSPVTGQFGNNSSLVAPQPQLGPAAPIQAVQSQQSLPPSADEVVPPIDGAKISHQQSNSPLPPSHIQQIHPAPMWDVYARTDFILTPETPTYTNIDYVRAAFRVGLKAMDSMMLPLHMGGKYNPNKKLDEVLWLLGISKSLGRDCLYKFSQSVINNIVEPYTMHVIIIEIVNFFEVIRLPENHIDRTYLLQPILDKCFERCMKQVKDLFKYQAFDQKSCIETIFDLMQTLVEVTRTRSTSDFYWQLLKFVDQKLDTKRPNRRSRLSIDMKPRLEWLASWTGDRFNVCCCDSCWRAGKSHPRFRHINMIRPNNNYHHHHHHHHHEAVYL